MAAGNPGVAGTAVADVAVAAAALDILGFVDVAGLAAEHQAAERQAAAPGCRAAGTAVLTVVAREWLVTPQEALVVALLLLLQLPAEF